MPKAIRKSKMISIRVSPEEYERLRSIYESRGIRNVSEFARQAMDHIINSDVDSELDLKARVRVLDTRLSILQGEFSQLSRMVAHNLVKKES